MEKLKSTGHIVTRNILIVLFIISFISAALYLTLNLSVQKARKDETVPELFGTKYIPISNSDVVSSQISYGSLVLLNDFESSVDVGKGSVIVYTTNSKSSRNAVFSKYSLGAVKSVDTEGEKTIYNVISGDSTIAVPSNTVDSCAVRVVNNLGSLVEFVWGTQGFILLFVVPCVLSALVFILYLIFLITDIVGYKSYEKELENQDYEYMDDLDDTSDTLEIINLQQQIYLQNNDDDDELETLPEIDTQTISTFDVNYMNFDNIVKVNNIKSEQDDISKKSEGKALSDSQGKTPSDNINIKIKEDLLKFDFENVASDNVIIEEDKDGKGFLIKTPKYEAKINVEIKNK